MVSLSRILHQNRLLRATKYHKTMDALFRSQLLYSPYLDVPFNLKMFLISTLSLFNLTVVTAKCLVLYDTESYSDLNFLMGDPTFHLEEARSFLLLLLFDWLAGCILQYSIFLVQLASSSTDKYIWLCIGEVLKTGQYKNWGSFHTIVKLFYRQIKLNCYALAVGFLFLANLPAVISAPRRFILPMLIHALLHSWAAFMASSTTVNFIMLYALYVHVWSNYLTDLSSELAKILIPEKYLLNQHNFSLDSIRLPSRQIRLTLIHLTDHYQEFIQSYRFYGLRNGLMFMVTFFANTFVMFLVFFTPMPSLYKLAIVLCGIFATLCGQIIQFYSGIYGQSRSDQAMRIIRKILYTKSSTRSRLIVLLFSDHFVERQFFTIYGSLQQSSKNLILTIAESSTLLLLLITNIGRRINYA